MITFENKVFKLDTSNTSYVFCITEKGHLEHIYYGKRLPSADAEALRLKNTIMLGTTVDYDGETQGYSLDTLPQEYSGVGKGDFRHSPIELIMPDGCFVNDFCYTCTRKLHTTLHTDKIACDKIYRRLTKVFLFSG